MTIKPVTYYEITCDEAGCRERPRDEYSAWADEDFALTEANEADWAMDNDGHHWCPKHYPTCPPGQHIRDEPDDICKRCMTWPEDDEPAATPDGSQA